MNADLEALPKIDLDRVASQLADVTILPVAVEDHIELRATAKFAIRNFDAGEYEVFVGLTEALLRLEHPAFDAREEYEAKIDKAKFSESLNKKAATDASAEGEASFGCSRRSLPFVPAFPPPQFLPVPQRYRRRFPPLLRHAVPNGRRGDPRDLRQDQRRDPLLACRPGAILGRKDGVNCAAAANPVSS